MSVKLAVAGSVMAGLVAVGGVAALAAFQPAHASARQSVEFVQPVAQVVVEPTTAPCVQIESGIEYVDGGIISSAYCGPAREGVPPELP